MFKDEFVIVDLETTGLSPVKNEIIEIGAIKVMGNKIVDTMDILVKPSVKIPRFITSLTGITNEMLEEGLEIKEALQEFTNFVKEDTIMAHNANFDLGFLRNNFQRHFQIELSNSYLDTLALSRKYVKGIPNYKLETLANYFHIDYVGAHRSLKDCEITYHVYNKIREICEKNTNILC